MSDSSKASQSELNLRHAFVAMLFAFAISRVGESTILMLNRLSDVGGFDELAVASVFHLLLAVLVITTSWIGWSRSSWKSTEVLTGPFQKAYLLLLIDIVLVINYYYLSLSVDVQDKVGVVSVREELVSILLLFLLYSTWEIVRFWGADRSIYHLFRENLWAVGKCLILVSVLWFFYCLIDHLTLLTVIGIDISLISVVILFRAFKLSESKSSTGQLTFRHRVFLVTYLFGFLLAVLGWEIGRAS